jgi:hypothetical protein
VQEKQEAVQTAQTEVDGIYYNEEGLLCHRETGFGLEPQGQHNRGKSRRSWTRTINKEAETV